MVAKKTTVKKAVKKPAVKVDESSHPHLQELEAKLASYLNKTIGKNKTIEHVRKNAVKLIKEGQKKTKQEVREIEALIKKHPAAAVLVASAVGAAAGAVTGALVEKKIASRKKK